MNWKIIEHFDNSFIVEFEDGSTLNLNPIDLVEAQFKKPTTPKNGEPLLFNKGLRMGGAIYLFEVGGELPEHAHDEAHLHTIECAYGRVLVKRSVQGDVELGPGEIASILPEELHSVIGIEKSKTIHPLVRE
jgi:quercetin dioxygenase-like cupin family protein